MNKLKYYIIILIGLAILGSGLYLIKKDNKNPVVSSAQNPPAVIQSDSVKPLNPLSIEAMRQRVYPGSDIKIEETLANGSNYRQYIVSYLSDGLKIEALMTVPVGNPPAGGWPVILFNHGYIPPEIYTPTNRYVAYVDYFARNGYIVFKSNYRGNGASQGKPEGAYYSTAYTDDVLNAVSSIKKYKDVNPDKIGMWGHSLGGNITLRSIVISKDIKAAVIWAGVVGSYEDLMYNWQRKVTYQPPPTEMAQRNNNRATLIKEYGDPRSNPAFWQTIDPTYYLSDVTSPVELHQGLNDEEVPPSFTRSLYDKLIAAGKNVQYFEYPGADHNISGTGFGIAMQRSLAFFDKYLK